MIHSKPEVQDKISLCGFENCTWSWYRVGIFDNNWWSRPIFDRIKNLVFAEHGKRIFTVGRWKPQNCNPTNTRQVLLIQLSILLDFYRSILKYHCEIVAFIFTPKTIWTIWNCAYDIDHIVYIIDQIVYIRRFLGF